MKHLRSALAASLVLVLCSTLQVWARAQFVLDGGALFSSATVERLNEELSSFNARTGKEVVVVSVPSLDGKTLQQASEDEFAREQVNGVMIYLAKAEHQDAVIGDSASQAFFPPGSFASIRQAMRGYFRDGDFDTGIQTGVSLVVNQYLGHRRASYAPNRGMVSYGQPMGATRSAGGMGMFWTLLILVAGFLIVRALFRALMGPRMMPPTYGPGPGGFGGGPGYGGPGFGGGYGGGGGGGNFFSGLLGGLGGAWLGNELFGNHGGMNGMNGMNMGGNPMDMNQQAGFGGGMGMDNTGWQNDAGQADTGNASFGSFGDSGGGFGGGGDSGGFGGGDSGGGGGW